MNTEDKQKTASNQAVFRFYEELNEFLPLNKQKKDFSYRFKGSPSVKDAVEAVGVPHTEVDLILANGASVDFNYHLQNEDRIAVYPVFERLDISSAVKLRPFALRETKFVLDVHLGRLARLLRLLGFDSWFDAQSSPPRLIDISVEENRLLLTRSRVMLKSKRITHGSWIRNELPRRQIEEVLERFDIYGQAKPFSRCLVCNGTLEKAAKDQVLPLLPAKTRDYATSFTRCLSCRKVYWDGTHFRKLESVVKQLLKQANTFPPP